MASIKNTISISGGVLGFLIIKIYKTTSPSIEAAPPIVYENGVDDNPFNFEFTDLDNGVYIVKVFNSTDGVTTTTLRHDYWIDAATGLLIFERNFFTVGSGVDNAPDDSDTEYANTDLDGVVIDGIFQEGYRYLKKGVEWDDRPGGGFVLLGGRSFADGQTWSYEIRRTVVDSAPTPDAAFSDIVELTADTTLDSSYFNKTVLGSSAGQTLVLTLPNLAGVPDGKAIAFQHNGGNLINLHLTGGTFRFQAADKTDLYLGKGESLIVRKKTLGGVPKWYVTNPYGQWDRVGKREAVDVLGDNMILADGLTTYDGNVYKRLYDYVSNKVPLAQKVSFATYDTTQSINGETVYSKRGFWAIDTVTKQLKAPDMRNMSLRFVKNVGGADASRVDNLAGGYQHWYTGSHVHTGGVKTHSGAGGYIEGYGANNAPGSDNYDPGTTSDNNPGQENTVRNIGQIPVILI